MSERSSEKGERVLLPAPAARVLESVVEPGWTVDGACVSIDPELWFPVNGGITSRSVLEICSGCPVRRSCLATAIVNVEDGVWGGVQPAPRSRARAHIWRGAEPVGVLDHLLERAADIGGRRRFAA
jgi:hypothetical protein